MGRITLREKRILPLAEFSLRFSIIFAQTGPRCVSDEVREWKMSIAFAQVFGGRNLENLHLLGFRKGFYIQVQQEITLCRPCRPLVLLKLGTRCQDLINHPRIKEGDAPRAMSHCDGPRDFPLRQQLLIDEEPYH